MFLLFIDATYRANYQLKFIEQILQVCHYSHSITLGQTTAVHTNRFQGGSQLIPAEGFKFGLVAPNTITILEHQCAHGDTLSSCIKYFGRHSEVKCMKQSLTLLLEHMHTHPDYQLCLLLSLLFHQIKMNFSHLFQRSAMTPTHTSLCV